MSFIVLVILFSGVCGWLDSRIPQAIRKEGK